MDSHFIGIQTFVATDVKTGSRFAYHLFNQAEGVRLVELIERGK